jgi:inorganic pyrophosphatase
VDVLVITPVPLIPGVVVTCRPLGVLKMDDEAGGDNKLLAVPTDKILSIYTQWKKPEDLNPMRLKTIQHFFEHYKDLEPGKWVKVLGWEGPDSAKAEVSSGMAAWAARHAAPLNP